MPMMKAVRLHDYGGPDVLRYEDAPLPEPGDGQLLLRVHAAAINPMDWKVREGFLRSAIHLELPMTPGWDISGTVVAVGNNVDAFAVGEEVYAQPSIVRGGGYAEYAAVAVDEVARKPRSIDHIHAAALPVCATTAREALFDEAAINLQKGQTILIHGGAGGVGSCAIQLAKWRGARVIATASTRNVRFLRELGADVAVDYSLERFEDAARDVDAVLDTVGGETQARSWPVLRPGGVLASIATPPSEVEAQAYGVRAAQMRHQPRSVHLEAIARLVDARRLMPAIAEVLPLAQAAQAQARSQTGHIRGKLVLRVAG